MEEHSQRFVVGSSPSTENWVSDPEICCIALSPSSQYLGIAERGEKPCVTILDTQTLRKNEIVLIPSTVRSKEISSMSFSSNNRYLGIQCGAPDWKLCIFDWQQNQLVHSITTSKDMTPVHQIIYSPESETNVIAICHEDCIQIYSHQTARDPEDDQKESDKTDEVNNETLSTIQSTIQKQKQKQNEAEELKQENIEIYPYESESKWTCSAWIDSDTLIAGNGDGDVIVLKENKFQEVILSKDDKSAISYIQCINANILAIGASDCTVTFLQKLIENGITNWNLICSINISQTPDIRNAASTGANNNNSSHNPVGSSSGSGAGADGGNSKLYKSVPLGMSVDPSGRQLLITTKNKQIYCVDISNLSVSTGGSDETGNPAANSNLTAESIQKTITSPLGHFHFGGITGMDICVRKPWIVTCSEDKSICIWNYLTKKLEIVKLSGNWWLTVFHPFSHWKYRGVFVFLIFYKF